MSDLHSNNIALLEFLKESASLHRTRHPSYSSSDRVLWLYRLKEASKELRSSVQSVFFQEMTGEADSEKWLEIRKIPKPKLPPLPLELYEWVPQEFQYNPEDYLDENIEKLEKILKEKVISLVDLPSEQDGTKDYHSKYLSEHPHIKAIWLEYLSTSWIPWVQNMRIWRKNQEFYEQIDFMRRRLEEAEERYELVLGIGLLQWLDPTQKVVKRHILLAPAEIDFDASQGVLTVTPSSHFEDLRLELDMLDSQHRPQIDTAQIKSKLDEIAEQIWDAEKVFPIFQTIANYIKADSQIYESQWEPLSHTTESLCISYAPALILRERIPRAYDELTERLIEGYKNGRIQSLSKPWRYLLEDTQTSLTSKSDTHISVSDISDRRLYFPLPANEQQRKIAEKIEHSTAVLVKGPPGTGKSQTIANLICHFLATGQRVLVTAQSPRALSVLRDLLPKEIRDLCLTTLGGGREDRQVLERSVRGIIRRKDEWLGKERVQEDIQRLEEELCQIENEISRLERELYELREREVRHHTLPGYEGNIVQIANKLKEQEDLYRWFPDLVDERSCPLSPEEIRILSDMHERTPEEIQELNFDLCERPLATPAEFEQMCRRIIEISKEVADPRVLSKLRGLSEQQIMLVIDFLDQLDTTLTSAQAKLGNVSTQILSDLLIGRLAEWEHRIQQAEQILDRIRKAYERLGTTSIVVPQDVKNEDLLRDTTRRLEQKRKGSFSLLDPVLRETSYIEKRCRVNGKAPKDEQLLIILRIFLILMKNIEEFQVALSVTLSNREHRLDPRHLAIRAREVFDECKRLLNLNVPEFIPLEDRKSLIDPNQRSEWKRILQTGLALRRAYEPLNVYSQMIDECSRNPHPCVQELRTAIKELNPQLYASAWNKHNSLLDTKRRFQKYLSILEKIKGVHPEAHKLIIKTQGDRKYSSLLKNFRQAWNWAMAKAWLRKVADPTYYDQLIRDRKALLQERDTKVKQLTEYRAWLSFFDRFDNNTQNNLISWQKAMARIGKGTGKYAYRHRRSAQKYLREILSKIPAWIMPLHTLWETVDPKPELFDTVIIDEASQAGIDSLLLLLLAKRIIVVGDDQQNSPESVGILEDDVRRLANKYLSQLQYKDEFRPDTSLYDHAERLFGTTIMLREHFRCVPQIIRFSNDLCYDGELIPLRQPVSQELPPLRAVFVENGKCEEKHSLIINKIEADAIVDAILDCISREEYKGKTIGVIALQGHAQAEYIESRLALEIDPKERLARKIRCGEPATFQGDERDVIFLSLVISPEYRFRALTGLHDRRRFNVAMSRARDQVWLFHSVKPGDLSHEDLRFKLLSFFYSSEKESEALYEELQRLQNASKIPHRRPENVPNPYESWFEVDVAMELLRRHYRIRPQYRADKYRIDLVVEDGIKRLAIECDGTHWHGPEEFEKDLARQRQLERVGWTFVRIRESEFRTNPELAINRILEACKELGIQPIFKA